MSALSFTAPFILAALAALPAIWLLLRATPPSPKSVRFPAFDILTRLGRTPETPDRTPWPILLLRLVIAALAIVGIAGPVLNAPEPAPGAGPMIVVADNSWAAAPRWRQYRDAMLSIALQAERSERDVYFLPTASDREALVGPLTAAQFRTEIAETAPEPFPPDYVEAARRLSDKGALPAAPEIYWLSDGLDHAGAQAFADALKAAGPVTVLTDREAATLALYPSRRDAAGQTFKVALATGPAWSGDLVATARDGRELARAAVTLPPAPSATDVRLELPIALQNDLGQTRLEGVSSAAAVQLADARERRATIGFIASGEGGSDPLLSGEYYVRKALEPFAVFVTDTLENLIGSDASVIVLDDVGTLRDSESAALGAWIEKGGVVIRFSGSTLAEAAESAAPALLPVRLRGGGRAFGGALTWETPQTLGPFSATGPFADLTAPQDIFVRRQVLAEPGGETSERAWASLADGTPLVTGAPRGAGFVALFHVTATPEWSDLPLSSTFVAMLRKLTFLSTIGPQTASARGEERLALFRILDGYGALRQPTRQYSAATLAELAGARNRNSPPGLYGAAEAPFAVNVIREEDELREAAFDGVTEKPFAADPPVRLAPPLLALAVLLLLADGVIALALAGRLRWRAVALFAALVVAAVPPEARAQPLDRPVADATVDAALATRLAFVRTGDPAVDRKSERGLAALSRELARRTSLEPAPPAGVDPETDDLSVYPFLYWPLTAAAAAPSDAALANIESFMRFGGLLVFDTQDDERAVAGVLTPEQTALRDILRNLDVPPLAPAPPDHVLKRSFYLLKDLPGRAAGNPVWVQSGEGPNDSVTPVIIGGRDWAGAWASDELGRPLFPMATGGEKAREQAYRTGINMVMVALTGNYKSDQVHTPILLERLGKK